MTFQKLTFQKLTLTLCAGLSLGALTSASAQVDVPPPPPPNLGPLPIGPAGAPPDAGQPNIAVPMPPDTVPEAVPAAAGATMIRVNAAANRHDISPLIYGVAYATKEQLSALNVPLNRQGGNGTTRYNWKINATNHGNDYFFETTPEKSAVPGELADTFVADTKAGGAVPLLTVPMLGWVAKLSPSHDKTAGFSVAKYGPQEKTDQWMPDAGNGLKPDGKTKITGNDPNDANVPSTPEFQREWLNHLTAKWGKAASGGVGYYLLDNEPALWNSTHRDAHPQGATMDEVLKDTLTYAAMVKSADPAALTLGPEEWGWNGYIYSGADEQYGAEHHWNGTFPDRAAHGNMDYLPWLLDQVHKHDAKTGKRLLDYFTVHIYPQGGDGGDDVTPKIMALRNRSTRALWDPNYTDESWIKEKIDLIPRLKKWVAAYYPGTKIGITEYNWGAEKSMSGATAQADIWGIFGREGLDLATRWTTPDMASPTFKAMQMYRSYDGKKASFGSIGVADQVPDPDTLSSFAAVRRSDGALTVMVINKSLDAPTPVNVAVSNFSGLANAQVWQLAAPGAITHLPDAAVSAGHIAATLPVQSVTLFVIPAKKAAGQ